MNVTTVADATVNAREVVSLDFCFYKFLFLNQHIYTNYLLNEGTDCISSLERTDEDLLFNWVP